VIAIRTGSLCVLAVLASTAVLALSLSLPPSPVSLPLSLTLKPLPSPVPVTVPASVPAVPEPDWIPWYGSCARPTASARGELLRRVYAWITRVRPGWLADDSDPSVRFGCVDRGGIVLDVQLDDDAHPYPERGVWWVLRVTPRAIRVIASLTGAARDAWMEDSEQDSLTTLALVDLDGDGVSDPILLTDRRLGGAVHAEDTLRTPGRLIGTSDSDIVALGLSGKRLEVAIGDVHRCIGARGRWARC